MRGFRVGSQVWFTTSGVPTAVARKVGGGDSGTIVEDTVAETVPCTTIAQALVEVVLFGGARVTRHAWELRGTRKLVHVGQAVVRCGVQRTMCLRHDGLEHIAGHLLCSEVQLQRGVRIVGGSAKLSLPTVERLHRVHPHHVAVRQGVLRRMGVGEAQPALEHSKLKKKRAFSKSS
jgi:hypothetical protein